jgi:hypothetical protein
VGQLRVVTATPEHLFSGMLMCLSMMVPHTNQATPASAPF